MQDYQAVLYGGVNSDVIFYVIVAIAAVIFLFFVALGLNVLAMRIMMKGMSSHPRQPKYNAMLSKRRPPEPEHHDEQHDSVAHHSGAKMATH